MCMDHSLRASSAGSASPRTPTGPASSDLDACSASARKTSKRAKPLPLNPRNAPCTHNSWDNVRINKGVLVLRCRTCEGQWRVHSAAWFNRKCSAFNSTKGCAAGDACARVHIHTKKLSLEERVGEHGESVLEHVLLSDTPPPLCDDDNEYGCAEFAASQGTASGSSAASSVVLAPPRVDGIVNRSRPCLHNDWINVRVKKGLVTLQCQPCGEKWKQPLEKLSKCEAFPACNRGEACEGLHVSLPAKQRERAAAKEAAALLEAAQREAEEEAALQLSSFAERFSEPAAAAAAPAVASPMMPAVPQAAVSAAAAAAAAQQQQQQQQQAMLSMSSAFPQSLLNYGAVAAHMAQQQQQQQRQQGNANAEAAALLAAHFASPQQAFGNCNGLSLGHGAGGALGGCGLRLLPTSLGPMAAAMGGLHSVPLAGH